MSGFTDARRPGRLAAGILTRGGGVAYPPIEPYATGMLDTGDGNNIYWETCGNPDGVPVVIVHGGPGSGCSVRQRKAFDPQRLARSRAARLRAHLRALLLPRRLPG